MAMSKKDFIALADAIRNHNTYPGDASKVKPFDNFHLNTIATCLQEQNPNFNRSRWLDYIAGKCGPNGGCAMIPEIPQAVIDAIKTKFDPLDLTEPIMAELRYSPLNGCWFFTYAGMLHGVEPDGYIHT